MANSMELQRPHDSIPGYLQWRQAINKKPIVSFHPHASLINNWSLNNSMLITVTLKEPREVIFVNTEEQLKLMVNALQYYNEFTVDTEMDTTTYFQSVVLIQVSTFEKDYVIDSLVLNDKIKQFMSQFFEDGTKLKVFHSMLDIIPLQINFDIYPVGIINAQEAYKFHKITSEPISLKNMAFELLKIKLDKSLQTTNWSKRPLSDNQLKYAANDTYYLFKCWIELKEKYSFHSILPSFPESKEKSLLTSSHLTLRSTEAAWQSYNDTANKIWQKMFFTEGQKKLFDEIFNWRENVGKEIDAHPHRLLSKREHEFLTRSMPTTIVQMKKLLPVPKINFIPNSNLEELVDIIKRHKPDMHKFSSIVTVESKKPCRLTNYDIDKLIFSASDSEFETDSDMDCYPSISDQVKEASNDNQPPALQNVGEQVQLSMSKQARKLRRNRINRKLKGRIVRNKPKVKRNSSAVKRVTALFKTALRYQVTQSELMQHINKLPSSLKK